MRAFLSLLFRKHPMMRFLLLPAGFLLFSLFFSAVSLAANRKPVIESLSPAIGEPGDVIVIRGKHFGHDRGDSWIEIGGDRLSSSTYLSWNDKVIMLTLPSTVVDGLLFVHSRSGRSNPELFANRENIPVSVRDRADPGLPAISAVSAAQVPVRGTLTLSGSNFGITRNQSQVFFSWQLDPAIPRSGSTQTELSVIPCSEHDFDYEFWSDKEVRIRVPDGAVSGNVYVKTDRGLSNGMQVNVTNPAGIKKFGTRRTYVLSAEVSVTNVVAAGDNILYLRIPRPSETPSQQAVGITASSVEPYMEDYRGAILHRLENLVEGDKRQITHSFIITNYSVDCSVNEARVKPYEKVTEPLYTTYTAPDSLVPASDPAIASQAAAVVKKEKNPWKQANLLYQWIGSNIAWSRNVNPRNTAAQSLTDKRGDSQDLSVLFCAMARSLGIPAVPVAGILVDANRQGAVHWWAEFYVENFGWVPVDLAIPALDGSVGRSFGSLDVNHIAFSRGWTDQTPMLPNSKVVWRSRSWALQPIWEESAGNITGYTSYWAEPKVSGVY